VKLGPDVIYTTPSNGPITIDRLINGLKDAVQASPLSALGVSSGLETGPSGYYMQVYGPLGADHFMVGISGSNGLFFNISVSDPGSMASVSGISENHWIVLNGAVSAGMIYSITILPTVYSYTAIGGDTPASVCTALAALVDADPNVTCTATSNNIYVTGNTYSVDYSLTCSVSGGMTMVETYV
jgi:hypothetical protein